MPDRAEIVNFTAGPAGLPTAAIQKGAEAFVNFQNTGCGLAEISHRSPTANKILSDTKEALATLYDIPLDEYDILFMQGGGSGEFSASVQNLVSAWVEKRRRKAVAELGEGKDAEVLERVKSEIENELRVDYLVTGSWSQKASQEAARLIGSRYINVAVDAKKANGGKFGTVPSESDWKLTKLTGKAAPAMVYYCDNETVDGVEFAGFPQVLDSAGKDEDGDPIVVADMSSNFVSRKVDVRKYGVIFGGAQKNLGVTGITVVIIRKSLLSLVPPPQFMHALGGILPSAIPPVVFTFNTIASNNSLYNTLSIFDLYISTLVLQGLVSKYGSSKIGGQEDEAQKKSDLLYDTLDKYSEAYYVVPDKSVRSRMNVCFRVVGSKGGAPDADKEKAFLAAAETRGFVGLKGHRSVGGIRASIYNAVTPEQVQKLCEFLSQFAEGKDVVAGR